MASGRALALAAGLLVVAGCGAKATDKRQDISQAVNEEGVSLSVCGVVDRYVAPVAPHEGKLTIDDIAWSIAPTAHVGGANLLAKGAEICIVAGMDPEGRITDCEVFPKTPDPWDGGPPVM
jgi:hypothetical protein